MNVFERRVVRRRLACGVTFGSEVIVSREIIFNKQTIDTLGKSIAIYNFSASKLASDGIPILLVTIYPCRGEVGIRLVESGGISDGRFAFVELWISSENIA